MARARNIKPGFFKNEDLAECSPWARLCFAGLWVLADRDGRLEDRQKRIKGELFAFDVVEVEPLLAELQKHGFILRYQTPQGLRLIQILMFWKHQNPHHKEPKSTLPSPESLGLMAHGTMDETETLGATEGSKTLDKPEALGATGEVPSTRNRAESKPLIPESKPLIPKNQGEPVVIPATPARSLDDGPPEANGQQPTAAGRVCRAMRQAGLQAVNPGDPRLIALLDQGYTEAEFVGVAAEAVGGGKGWAWVLTVVQRRRADAAAIAIAPGGPPPQRGPAAPNVTVPSVAAERTQALLREQAEKRQDKPSAEVLARIAAIKRVAA